MSLKGIITAVIMSLTCIASAAPFEDLGSYSGPLYRALEGNTVVAGDEGLKTVLGADSQTVLIQCYPQDPNQSGFHNNYNCSVNFKSVKGKNAEIVFAALNGQSVVIGQENAIQGSCKYLHCVSTVQITCSSPKSCSVQTTINGWDE